DVGNGLPRDLRGLLSIWRAAYTVDPRTPGTLTVGADSPAREPRRYVLPRQSVVTLDDEGRSIWLRQHLGPIAQLTAFLSGATVLVVLGARGLTAALMILALIGTGV